MTASFDDDFYLLLDRYLAGEATAAEVQHVRDWLAENPDHAAIIEDVRLIRRAVAERPPESSVDAAWQKAVEDLGLNKPSSPRRDYSTPQIRPFELPPIERRRFSPALAAAAAVVLLVGGALLWRSRQSANPVAAQWSQVVTQAAQRATV